MSAPSPPSRAQSKRAACGTSGCQYLRLAHRRMNLVALSPGGCWLLALLLVAAATEDAIRMRVSNLISFGVLALAVCNCAGRLDLGCGRIWCLPGPVAGGTLFVLDGNSAAGTSSCSPLGPVGRFQGRARTVIVVSLAGGLLALLILAARMSPRSCCERVIVLKPAPDPVLRGYRDRGDHHVYLIAAKTRLR